MALELDAVRRIAGMLATVVAILGVYWLLLFIAQRSMLFQPPGIAGAPARPADARQIWLATSAGEVEAWYLPPLTVAAGPAPLLLFAHGNAELIDFWPAEFEEPRRRGVSVLLLEYPGYGRSQGRPSQRTISAATLAAYDWALRQPGIDPNRIVGYGRSVGAGAVCTLIGERQLAGIVLESSFTSVRAFARRYGAPAFLVRDPFDNLAALREYDGPVLVVHGARDDVIPTEHGRALAAAAPRAELYIADCAHNDCERPWERVTSFLARHGLLQGEREADVRS